MLVKIQNDPISMGLWKYVTKLHMFLPFGQKNFQKKENNNPLLALQIVITSIPHSKNGQLRGKN
jgi:hypothetical protein